MQISKILETKNKLIRENTADVVKAMTPMMILYIVGFVTSWYPITSFLMIVADIYFIYTILNLIAPSREYKKAFERNKIPMLLNYAAYTLLTTIAIITIVVVGSGAILASVLTDHSVPVVPPGFWTTIAFVLLIIIIIGAFISQTTYLITYAGFGKIDKKYLSFIKSVAKSVTMMKKYILPYILLNLRLLIWVFVPFVIMFFGVIFAFVGVMFYFIALISAVPISVYASANLVVGRLLFFEELVKQENLLQTTETTQKPKRKLNLDAID